MSKLKIRLRGKYRINREILVQIELQREIKSKIKPLINNLFGSSFLSSLELLSINDDYYDMVQDASIYYLQSKVKYPKKRYN